ncbi:hypothetical protein GT347_16860 [Xylophilus rhododendri]|uniref:Uncharacterized protein n=1 Tax=Xylophilus rhododendri TaxID=2697032 RepID=A0A857J9S2_9BURK|nr:hypothetical protein [Xylophilus rhododendri]QHI99498.1 hypothetical protein GT347_16860 [Xylophilus rhododendri]
MAEPSRRIPYRSWPGALAVLLAILVYVGGLMAWDRHTPGSWPLASGETIEVGPVRFIPAEDWRMDVARSRAGRSLTLFKGGHRFVVTTGEWAGGPEGPVRRQRRLMERGQGLSIDGDPSRFFNSWGLGGDTFAYYGAQLAGRFWQVVDPRRRLLVQVDCYGPAEGLNEALADARAMVDSMDLDAL